MAKFRKILCFMMEIPRRFLFFILLSLLISGNVFAQNTPCKYEEAMQKQGLLEVKKEIPAILIDLKYHSSDNFMHKNVYGCLNTAYLQKEVIDKLKKAQAYLQTSNPNLRILIYDAARPLSIQWILWNTLSHLPPNERQKYVANPKEHSIHNYGSAIDLTLADSNGMALDMGTKYDFFGELAYPKMEQHFLNTGELSPKAFENRQLLRNIMKKAGFMPIDFEWWHFNAFARKEAKARYKVVK
jgi:D-alanyl-D-alanine dipeptidase